VLLAVTIAIAAIIFMLAIGAMLAEAYRNAWGRLFDRELRQYAGRNSGWIPADNTPEALYRELLQRSDRLTAALAVIRTGRS
jgi:hypothetical protein